MTRLSIRLEPAPSPAQLAAWRALWALPSAPHPREASGPPSPAGDGAPAGKPCPRASTARAQDTDNQPHS